MVINYQPAHWPALQPFRSVMALDSMKEDSAWTGSEGNQHNPHGTPCSPLCLQRTCRRRHHHPLPGAEGHRVRLQIALQGSRQG